MPSITYCKNVYNVVEMSAIVQTSRKVLNTGMKTWNSACLTPIFKGLSSLAHPHCSAVESHSKNCAAVKININLYTAPRTASSSQWIKIWSGSKNINSGNKCLLPSSSPVRKRPILTRENSSICSISPEWSFPVTVMCNTTHTMLKSQ